VARRGRRQTQHVTVHLDRTDAAGRAPATRAGQPFVGLVSGAEVPVLELDLPPDLKGPARERVARRRLTDMIGPDGAQAELRPIPPTDRGRPWRRALMADKAALAGWRRRAGQTGGRCLALLPDYLALPAAPGLWVLEIGAKTVSARLGVEDGFTAEPGLARRMLTAALARETPKGVLRTGPAAQRFDDLFAGRDIVLADDPAAFAAKNLPRPERFAHGELKLDLGHDRTAETARMIAALQLWRGAGALALLGFGLWAASLWIAAEAERDLAAAYRAEAEALTRAHFVPSGPILDIRRQVAAALAQRQTAETQATDTAGPLDRLRRAATVLAPAGAHVVSAGYQAETGWILDLETPDFAALDQIVTDLAAAGLTVEVAESRAEDDGRVSGTLILTGSRP